MLMAAFFPRALAWRLGVKRTPARSPWHAAWIKLGPRARRMPGAQAAHTTRGPLASKRDRLAHHGSVFRVRAGRGLRAAASREDQHRLQNTLQIGRAHV